MVKNVNTGSKDGVQPAVALHLLNADQREIERLKEYIMHLEKWLKFEQEYSDRLFQYLNTLYPDDVIDLLTKGV